MIKMKTKLTFISVILGLTVVILLSGCINSSTVDVRYGGQYYPGEFLLKGHPEFWSKYDITVKHTLFSSGTENNEALLSGEVDINCGSDTKTIALFGAAEESQQIEPIIIGTLQRGDRYSTIIPQDSDVTSWVDLIGKKIGYRAGTGADTIMRRYFALNPDNLTHPTRGDNVTFDDFDWQSMNVEDMPSALEAGQIEAFTAWEPTPAIAVDSGIGKILRSYGDVALVPVSIHTTKEFASKNPDVVIAFLAAQLDKQDMIESDPTTAASYAATAASEVGSSVTATAFEDLFERIDYSIDFNESIINDILNTADFLKNKINPPLIDEIPTIDYNRTYILAAKELQQSVNQLQHSSDGEKSLFSTKASPLDLANEIAYKYGLGYGQSRRNQLLNQSLIQQCYEFILELVMIDRF